MSQAPTQYSFENLTQSGLFRLPSKEDKNVSLSFDVFGGFSSFCIFTGQGGKPWKLTLPRKTIDSFIILLENMIADPRPKREPVFLNRFEEADGRKGFKQYGCIGFGIDDNLSFYIDVAANELPNRYLFVVKKDGRFDFSNTSMNEKDSLKADISFIINVLKNSAVAERLTAFKRQNTGGAPSGGGNRGGFNQSGGGNNYSRPPAQSQSSTFGGAPDTESELNLL